MDMKKLAERLDKLTNKGGGKNVFFKPNEEDQVIRILPYTHQEDNVSFIEVFFHYDIAGHRSIVCPQETLGDPCPICKVAEDIRQMGGKENWNIFRNLQARLRTYAPVIVRGKEDEGVKLWGFGKTIYEQLLTTCVDEGDISDLKEGHDLTVKQIPVGAPGNDTSFPKPICKVSFKQSVALSDAKKLKEILKSIPNYLEDEEIFKVYGYDELCEIVEKLKNEDADEEFTDEVNVEDNSNDFSSNDDDDLKSKLDNLLND